MAEGYDFNDEKSSFTKKKKKNSKGGCKKVHLEENDDQHSTLKEQPTLILTGVEDEDQKELLKLIKKEIEAIHEKTHKENEPRYQIYQYQSEEKIITSLMRLPGLERIMPKIDAKKLTTTTKKETTTKKAPTKKMTPIQKKGSIVLSKRNQIIENEHFWFGSFVTLGMFICGIAKTWQKEDFKCPPETMFYIIMEIVKNCKFGESFTTKKWEDFKRIPEEIVDRSKISTKASERYPGFIEAIKTLALSSEYLNEKTRDNLPLVTPLLKAPENPPIVLAFSEKKLSKNEINKLCAKEGLNPNMFQSVQIGDEFLLNQNIEKVTISTLDIDRIFDHLSALKDYLPDEEWAKARVHLINKYEEIAKPEDLVENKCYQLLKEQFVSSSRQDRLSDESIYFELSRSFIASEEKYRKYFKEYNDGIGILLRHWGFADVQPYTTPSKETDKLELILILKKALTKKMPHLVVKEWLPEMLDKETIEKELEQRKINESLFLRHEAFEHFKPVLEELDLRGAKLSLAVLLPLIDVLNSLIVILKRLGNDKDLFQKVDLYLTEGTKALPGKTKDLILFSPEIMQNTDEKRKNTLTYDGVLLALQARSKGQSSAAPKEYLGLFVEIEDFIKTRITT